MDKSCMNADGSIYFCCRKSAAAYNDKLESREGAAEYLGVSVSSLANYELGITVVPVDVLLRMADLYNAPQLKNLYCKNECQLGKDRALAVEVKSLEAVTIRLLSILDSEKVSFLKKELIKIAHDGKVGPDEIDSFAEIVSSLDNVALAVSELKLLQKMYSIEIEN